MTSIYKEGVMYICIVWFPSISGMSTVEVSHINCSLRNLPNPLESTSLEHPDHLVRISFCGPVPLITQWRSRLSSEPCILPYSSPPTNALNRSASFRSVIWRLARVASLGTNLWACSRATNVECIHSLWIWSRANVMSAAGCRDSLIYFQFSLAFRGFGCIDNRVESSDLNLSRQLTFRGKCARRMIAIETSWLEERDLTTPARLLCISSSVWVGHRLRPYIQLST